MRGIAYLLCLLLAAITTLKAQEKPNILWISCEDISPAWGCYGDEQATTPNIDQLAAQGYVFQKAFSNAPICAPARSTLITGMYATSLGTQNLRSDIPVSSDLEILPELLRTNGYFTTNNSKTDYNFSPDGRWDELSRTAHWRNRKLNQPFFSVFNFGITHEGHANSDKPEDTASLLSKHNPEEMKLPPYFPKTEEFRHIMAHQYDLITVFDQEVGKLLEQLATDDLLENTIVFIFSDHGYGLPRHKRWLYNSGLQVPFVLYVPPKYKQLTNHFSSPTVKEMVAFVDFAPTVLEVTNTAIPKTMHGVPFLGAKPQPKPYTYGYRDRADDVYDMSRSVFDGRFLYIRHFMPHRPYIQNAIIFNKGKRSYEELFRLKATGELPTESQKMFLPKPVEELYDLENDPFELNNLIQQSEHQTKITELRAVLKKHLLDRRDSGLMNEGDMMERAAGTSVYEVCTNPEKFKPAEIYEVANLVGRVENLKQLKPYFKHSDPAIRFWAMQALYASNQKIKKYKKDLIQLLDDSSIPNQALAAEILINKLNYLKALPTLTQALQTTNESVLLQVAISVRNIGAKAAPLLPFLQEKIYPNISGSVWGRYKNWSYPMFIGMALDQTLMNCGQEVQVKN